jgi:oligosaccharide repeat unit polymerase
LTSFRRNADIFTPARVFIFVWALAFGLADLKFSRLQHEWTPEVWIQMLIGPAAFLIGVAVIYSLNVGKTIWTLNNLRANRNLYLSEIDSSRLYRTIIILFFLFIVSYILIYLKAGEIPLFSPKPGRARANFTMFGIGLFLHNVVLIVFFTAVYFLVEKGNKMRKGLLLIFSITSLALYTITLQRYQIFMTIIMVIVLLFYTTFHIKFKTVFFYFLLITIFFLLISTLRAGEIFIYILYRASEMKFSPDYAVFTEPYMYIVMNLENFARSIVKAEHFTYGYYTFDFVTAISGVKHWLSDYYNLIETPYLISSYNTYTAFWTYYRDFGIFGIFIIPLLGGILFSIIYYSFKVKPTLQRMAIYAMFLFGIIFSFFNSVFGFLWFVYNLIVLLLILKYIHTNKIKEGY